MALSRITGWLLAGLVSVSLLAGCAAGATPVPPPTASPASATAVAAAPTVTPSAAPVTPAPTVMPTVEQTAAPTPAPTPAISDADLLAACIQGRPIPEAAKYTGAVHAFAVVSQDQPFDDESWNRDNSPLPGKYYDYGPSPLQLVACVGAQTSEPAGKAVEGLVGYCGNYRRTNDGFTPTDGDVWRNRAVKVVRIVIARTGKTLYSKTFYGSIPTCDFSLVDPGGDPPWDIYGDDVSAAAIDKYVISVSTQKAR